MLNARPEDKQAWPALQIKWEKDSTNSEGQMEGDTTREQKKTRGREAIEKRQEKAKRGECMQGQCLLQIDNRHYRQILPLGSVLRERDVSKKRKVERKEPIEKRHVRRWKHKEYTQNSLCHGFIQTSTQEPPSVLEYSRLTRRDPPYTPGRTRICTCSDPYIHRKTSADQAGKRRTS